MKESNRREIKNTKPDWEKAIRRNELKEYYTHMSEESPDSNKEDNEGSTRESSSSCSDKIDEWLIKELMKK